MSWQKIYEKALKEFCEKVIEDLNGDIESLVVYGSVARGEGTEDSDIDVMVVAENIEKVKKRISTIRYDNDLKHETFTTLIYLAPNAIEKEIRLGSPFIEDVLTQGKILYDRGTFKRISEKALGVSR